MAIRAQKSTWTQKTGVMGDWKKIYSISSCQCLILRIVWQFAMAVAFLTVGREIFSWGIIRTGAIEKKKWHQGALCVHGQQGALLKSYRHKNLTFQLQKEQGWTCCSVLCCRNGKEVLWLLIVQIGDFILLKIESFKKIHAKLLLRP